MNVKSLRREQLNYRKRLINDLKPPLSKRGRFLFILSCENIPGKYESAFYQGLPLRNILKLWIKIVAAELASAKTFPSAVVNCRESVIDG